MSYLSASENVSFSGIQQNVSDASCATQYKMAMEGATGSCGDVTMYINDSSEEEQSYIPHLNDNFFHTKFKIDQNELYTFNDSDVIAGEITVTHTDNNFIFDANVKTKLIESSKDHSLKILNNGEIKKELKKPVVSNGYHPPITNKIISKKDIKTVNTKVLKSKSLNLNSKELARTKIEVRRQSVRSDSMNNVMPTDATETNVQQGKSTVKVEGPETFLDVFKREQGVIFGSEIKTEPSVPPLPSVIPAKTPTPISKKSGKAQQSKSQSKPRKGRGPAVHEALQRISGPSRAIPVRNTEWHAPGENLFECGPLQSTKPAVFKPIESSSSEDDTIPDFDARAGPVSVEECAAESRGARLELRRAALRRHVTRAHTALRTNTSHTQQRALAHLIKKQLSRQGPSSRLPTQTINHLLAMRGMSSLLTSHERRKLRQSGWSGGESVSQASSCAVESCPRMPLPCCRHCLTHVALSEQRLYVPCAAVFAAGDKCNYPMLPLKDHTPLCDEHAWKRDNYDKLTREVKPRKPVRPRAPAPPRRNKRRRRIVRTQPAHHSQSLAEINVCSNSSAYDSSEENTVGIQRQNEYIVTTSNSHELEEVGQVPPDDILDPSVLSQMPDEAFTEFFNQAESVGAFGAGSELAAALEAVLDERELDISDAVFAQHHDHKVLHPASVGMEMSSSAPS